MTSCTECNNNNNNAASYTINKSSDANIILSVRESECQFREGKPNQPDLNDLLAGWLEEIATIAQVAQPQVVGVWPSSVKRGALYS